MKINFLLEAREILVLINVKAGLSVADAKHCADAALELFAQRFAGEKVYIGKSKFVQIDRDERIYAAVEYGKVSIRDVATRYNISTMTAHKALCRVRAKFRL